MLENKKAWLFPFNCNKYDLLGSLIKNGFVDYGTNLKEISKDDIVYVYSTAPYSSILFKCIVKDELCIGENTDDSEFRSKDEKISSKSRYLRLYPIQNYLNKKELVGYDALINNGLKVVKSQSKLSPEVINYLDNI